MRADDACGLVSVTRTTDGQKPYGNRYKTSIKKCQLIGFRIIIAVQRHDLRARNGQLSAAALSIVSFEAIATDASSPLTYLARCRLALVIDVADRVWPAQERGMAQR